MIYESFTKKSTKELKKYQKSQYSNVLKMGDPQRASKQGSSI